MTVPALEMSWSCCSSTNRAVELGDRRWREVFEQYDATVRGELGDRVQALPHLVVFTPGGRRADISGADMEKLDKALAAK